MSKNTLLTLLVSFLFTGVVFVLINFGNTDVIDKEEMFKEGSVGIADDPGARMEYERKMLADPLTGQIPENIRKKELAFSKAIPSIESSALHKGNTLTWTARGPINRGGRTRALGIDVRTQTAPNITIIAAGASGGIYKSTDNGATWVNKLSADSLHSATCIAQDTRTGHQDTWYVGTGERGSNLLGGNHFATTFLGDGVYKSTDNGDHWTLLSSTSNGTPQSYTQAFDFVFDVAVSPTTGTVFAAASDVIKRSTDGGASWNTVLGSLTGRYYTDVQSTSTGIVYATISKNGGGNIGISRSDNDGVSWTNITPSTWSTTATRTVIGIAPSDPNVVYFWTYTASGTTKTELWKYTYPGSGSGVGDANWTNLTANLPAPSGSVAGINVQGAYDMVIKVSPNDPNYVILGGTNLYRSTDGFSSAVPTLGTTGWIGGYATSNDVSQYLNSHPDQHALVFLNSDTKVVYSGHDGGLSKTTDVTASTVSWANLNQGYVTSQFYSIAIDKNTANSNVIAGGMQDNGNYITFSNDFNVGWKDWGHGGDGGYAAVSANGTGTIYTIYLEAQNGWLWRQTYDNTGAQLGDNLIQPSYTGSFYFVNPFVLDPNNPSIMYFAQGDSVLRSTNVSGGVPTWSVMSHATTGGNGSISAFGVAKNVANRLYVGGTDGTVLRIDGANTGDPTATNLTSALTTAGAASGAYVNCITVDPQNADRVFVVYSNYSVRSLFESTDGGTSFHDISGNLEQNTNGSGNGPSCRWLDLIEDGGNTTVYVATSTGLYSTTALNGTSTNWVQEGASVIGNSVCPMVYTRSSDGLVVVGTHGSGIYSANQTLTGIESVTTSIPASYSLNQNYPNPFNPSTKIKFNLPQTNNVKLTIYDITGRKVKELVNQQLAAGVHTVDFDATNLASGTYIYRIQAGSFVQSKKMILLK